MLMMLLAVSANATTFKVTTTEDRKVGSLRWAIEQSNKEKALSNIVFDLPVGSVVTPDSTIDIKTSVVIDGQIDGGRIDISPVINEFRLFSMVHTELDSVVFQNLNIYEPKFEKEGHYTWHNSFIESDTTSGLLVLRNNHISKFQEMVVCRGNSLHIECYDCLCDSMYLDFFSNAKDIFGEEHNSSSWASLHVENSKFIYTYGPGFLQNGGVVGVTHKDEFINVYTEHIDGISNGNADTMIYRNCVFNSCKSDAINIGCDDLCISKVVVDSCQIIKSGGHGFKYLLDGSDIIFTNNVVYGSDEMDMYCSRQYFTDHYSTLRMENNLFGSPEYGNVGVVVDASNTIIRNNVFYGIDGYSEYMGEPAYALFDEGSDTLLIENNSFGINGDVKAPNKNGDLWLESEYQLADWKRKGFDYDYDLIPQVTVKGNKFYQSSPKAIRIDSTKLNVTMSENLFLETKDSAICNVKLLSKPTITEIKRKESNITIIGHVDSLAKIELFYTSGAPQTAEEFIDSIKTDKNGGFEFSIPYNKLKNKEQLCFTATATYSDGSTSNLSEVYCCSDCHLDPTRKEYYVKTERTGDGDGSSWENAMSGEDFVKVLPDAVAGATFYVAEGEYDLKVLSGENSIALKNNLSVIGGYGKNSNGKMTTDPSKYHTSFTNGYFYVNNGIHVEFDGLRFVGNENLDYCGYYAPSSLQTKTYVTLKNSVFVANGQSSAIIANSGCVTKLINDTIRGVCEYGIRAVYCVDTLSVEGSVIYGASDAGVFCEQNIVMKTSVISNNANYGLYLKLQSSFLAILEDNIIGLDVKGEKAWGNGIGVLPESSGGDKIQFKGNIIAGNLGTGIKINSTVSASFEGNYIGTNKEFKNLGNGGDGIYYASRIAAGFPSSIENANYVGFNGGNGISYDAKMAGGDISFNYIGITPQGNPMPNEGYGLYLYAQSRLAQNSISNIIGYNTAGGVYVNDKASGSRISQNLFVGTKNKAIEYNATLVSVKAPVLTKVERDNSSFIISGTIDTTSNATIELFYTNGDPQTAHKYLGNAETNSDGDFEITVPISELAEYGSTLCFSATAIYSKQTSELSDPFCCESCGCSNDTIMKKDTIVAGDKFLGKTYTIGLYENIFENLTSKNGCDSVVNHTLIVKPSSSVKEYYVKTSSEGSGDGSDWDNAMGAEDFAFAFPLVPSGTKFYIAKGEYQPMYGTNGKVPTRNYDKVFFTKKCVSLYGGFPSSAKGTDLTNDPAKYHTILSGDFDNNSVYDASNLYADNRQEDAQNILHIIPEESGDIIVSGIEFKGTYQHSSAGSAAFNLDSDIEGVTCNIEKCTFSLAENGLIASPSSLNVTDCYFYNNSYNGASVITDECVLTNCTFEGNRTCYFGDGNVTMQNCTSMGEISAYDIDEFNFVNNTLVGDLKLSGNKQCTLTGNILGGVVSITDSPVTSSYNIYLDVNSENEFIASTDLVRSETDMMPSDGKIVLANHGGFTPTIALERDKLSDGTSIRFPLSKTTVITDQRGVARLENTCMGAYEIECSNDTTLVRDTIYVGEKFMDVTYSQVGVHDSIFENLKAKNGCDSVVMHTLLVKPDPTVKEYYVKTKREGKGDGSSWENAMDGEDFERSLELVPDSVTFFMAEGTYTPHVVPRYNLWGELDDCYFLATSYVKIIGGFPKDAKTGAVSNPSKYETVFDADVKGDDELTIKKSNITGRDSILLYTNKEDNVSDILKCLHSHEDPINEDIFESDTAFYVSGITFKNASYFGLYLDHSFNHYAVVEQCKFDRNRYGIFIEQSAVKINDCYFINNNSGLGRYDGQIQANRHITIQGCTFEKNNFAIENAGLPDGWVIVKNSTIVNNMNLGAFMAQVSFVNNTILNNSSIYLDGQISQNIEFKGNLVDSLSFSYYYDESVYIFESKNNVWKTTGFPTKYLPSESDILVSSQSDFYNLFDGTVNTQSGWFTPNIVYNGGFTPTIALKSDKLPDGTSIRFPLSETIVTEDQRGVARLDSTCMGAYEISCSNDTVTANDTIIVGENFLDVTYTQVGVHDSIFEVLKTKNGCDSTIMHRLIVKPDPSVLAYYVKTKSEGKGDGSSWEDAMNGDDFAACLPLAPDGATFYVAEGTYKPKYGYNLSKVSNTSSAYYEIKSSVTIRGGYPADAKGTTVTWNPKKNVTIFDGDVKGDDIIDLSLDEDGYPKLTKSNTEDNISYMFQSLVSKELNFTIEGVVVKNTNYRVLNFPYENKHLILRHDSIVNGGSVANMLISGESLKMYNCYIINNNTTSQLFYIPNISELVMDSVILKNNRCEELLFVPSCLSVQVLNSNFDENVISKNYMYAGGTSSEIVLRNDKWNNNNGGTFYLFQTSFTVDSCLFNNNKGTSYLFNLNPSKLCDIKYSKFIKNSYEYILYEVADSVAIGNTLFDSNNVSTLLYGYTASKRYFANNTFINNNADKYLINTAASGSVSKLVNNTITKNVTGDALVLLYDHPMYFYNNTIVGNTIGNEKGALLQCDFYHSWADLYGNIILGNAVPDGKSEYLAIRGNSKKKNNILTFSVSDTTGSNYPPHCHAAPDASNIISVFDPSVIDCDDLRDYIESVNYNPGDVLSAIFEGTYDTKTNLFTPEIDYYVGFTPVIALKKDKLPDGTSIRFPLTETTITEDQRGVARLENTCMGAYEIICHEVGTDIKDEIVVGESYDFGGNLISPAKPGIVYVNDTLTGYQGCDSIIHLTLLVRPIPSENGYFVKQNGTGDGHDWLNAMSPADFAAYLPVAYDGDTFHIAEGTYHPFEEIPGRGLGYKVNSSVVLVGGYPDTATILETQCNPMLYETVLSANVSRKDYFYSYVDCSISPFSSVEDNLSTLIYADEKVNLSIFGVTLSGVYSCDRAAIQLDAAESSLNLEHCIVSKNAATAIKASNGSHVTVSECYFNENYTNRAGVFDLSDATLKVTHSTFDHNRVSGTYCPADNIDSVAGVAFLKNSTAAIENSTFTYNNATKGGVFYLDGSDLSLANVTITGNGNFTDDATDGSVIYSSPNPSDVKLFGNIIVGNGKSVFAGDGLSVSSSNYNIFSQQPSWKMGEKDLLMNDDEMITILDGEINNYYPKSYFQPTLRLVEGYTPIVAVITSTFSGGEVLSILRKDQRVKDDQRGFLRKDTCCIGAYEFPTLTDYYVKVIATGDGSGRNWNNAMSDTTFATYFPIVPNKATFHIAAGTYYPLKDGFGNFGKSAQCSYSTTRSINMIGGYPELAKEGDTTNPSVNYTILSADRNNDNTVSIVKYDDDYSYININNISDNGYRVIDITPKSSGETSIYGIIFEGSKSIPRGSSSAFSYYTSNEQVGKLTLDHCTFRKSYSATSISATTVVVNECRFDSIEAYAFSAISYTPAELTLNKSTFNLTGTAVNLREVFNAEISNNTIVDARTSFNYYNSGFEDVPMNVKMYNNTVSNGANFKSSYNTISDEVKLEAKGNIFNIQRCYFSFNDNTPLAITSDYNIFTSTIDSEGNTWKFGEHDVLLQPTDLVGVLDGTYSDEKASFVATLSENGGFCDNVSLLNVVLPDDKSIKMIPTGTTPVADDQRYVKRDEVYCAGSYEVDCSFSNGNLKLVPSNTEFCRDDTVIVKLEGLSKLEANTFKYRWFADNDSVRAFDADSNAVKFHLYSRQSNPKLNVTITNACGNDTTIHTSVHVNGTGAVPFSEIEENDIVCQNAAQPIELTTNVAGAVFEGECIVNEHFFDPSLASADTTLIRCWVAAGECKSFDDKKIRFTKSAPLALEKSEDDLILTCSNMVGFATVRIVSESEDEYDAYFDTKHIGTYKSNDKIEIKAIEKGSHTLFVESKVEVCPASSSIPLNVSAPNPISVRLESQGVGCGATVTAFASGETGLYQYVWKNEAGETLPSTSEVLSGIGAGTYTCIVSSVDCGTKVTEQATIDPVDDKGELSVTFVKTDETCVDGNNGTITVTLKASNPNEKVTIVLTSDKNEFKKVGSQRGGDIAFDNLPPSQYVMTAYFGSEDCVSAPTDVKETINIAKKTTKLSITSINSEKNTCLSPLNGYISATVNGWDNGYVALLNDKPVDPSNVEGEVATFKLESVSAGDYVFYVEDNCKSHSDSKNVSISSINPYKLEIVKYTDTLDCAKSLMGYAQFKKEGGNEENSSVYIVGKTGWSSLNEDQIVLINDNFFANLKKDQYTLYYKSNLEGCLDADSLKLTVKGPDTLAADYVISCKEDETVIKITASGENGEYKYRWNGGDFSLETDDSILAPSSLEYGLEYTCEVRDSKGCDMKSFTFNFVHPDKLKGLKMRYSLDPQSCIGVPNAKVYAVVAQKEDKYEATFVLMNVDDNSVVKKISVSKIESAICFSDLPVGNYQLKLRYGGEDCEMGGPSILSDTIKVEPLLPLKGKLGETTGLTCLNEPNGKAEISLSSGWSKHHISTLLRKMENKWDVYNESLDATSSEGQSALYEINGLEGGSYQFIIKDNCGKDSLKFSFEVSDFEPYSIQLVNKTKFLDCYTDDTAHIEVSVSGGYFFDNEFYLAGVDTQSIAKAENFKYTDLTAGLYHFHYGTTQEACSDSVMLDVKIETDSIFVNLDNSGVMCYDAKLQATVKGGKEPYTLVWGNENADSIRIDNAQPFVLENVGVASYFATVVDKIGCKAHSETVFAQLVGDMSKENGLRIDSISLNALQCLFPSENGDIRVFVVGNTYRANVSVKVKQDNSLLNEITTSAESDTITFDGLPFDQTYQLSVSFQGAEECAAGNDNLNRSILLTKPEPFSVDFKATKVLCANSHDAEIASNIHAGAHTYHYEWHKLIEDKEDEIITHDVLTSDTLRDLRKEERYFCKVVDQNFCESLSDTFTIGYSEADTMQLDTFEYDERQRCKGVDNAHMYVSFNKVAPWVDAQFDLSVVDGDALDKQDQDENNDRIHINELGPNKYHLIAGYGVEGCPTLLDTTVEIFEMVGDLKVAANPDSTHDALCVSTKDGAIYFHLDGVAKKQVVEIYDEEGNFLKKVQQDSLSVERGFYKLTGLLAGTYKVKVTNDCDVKDSSTYTLGGYNKYELTLEEDKSHLSLQCPYSEDGAIAFSIVGHESNFTLNFMTYDTTIIDNYKDSVIISDCVIKDSTRMKDTIYTMYNRDETSVSVHSSVAPKMETKVIDDQTVYNYYLSVDSILGEVDTFAVVKELLPGTGVHYKYAVKEKSGAIKWELSNISMVDTIAPTEQDGDTLYRFHTMVDSFVCVRDTDNMKMTWNYVMDPNNDTLFLYQYYEIPTKCFDTVRVIAGKVVQYHPVLNELDADDATLKDGIYYFTNFKKGDYYIKAKTTMENCPDADTMNVKITAPNNVILTKEILPVSCRSKNDGSVSLKPYREGGENSVLYFGRDSILFKSNYKANYLYKRTSTKHDQNGDNYTSYDYENVIFNGDTVMVNINDLSNYSSYFVKKHDGSNVSVSSVTVDENVDQATLFGGDIVSVVWKRMNDAGNWETINDQIVWPASTDSLEETYFSSNGDTIKGFVWGASHLETFWDDYMGTYQEVGVQTIANMSPAKYAVHVTDAVGCVYDFDFEVKEPEDALKIESVEYNASLALCKPEERHIFVRASGGWGDYKYSFSAEADTSSGYVVDEYNGGEAYSYDPNTKTGWGRSACLLDGIYKVSVIDEKGCIITFDDPIEVKSLVQVTADTSATLCPGVVSAPISLNVSNTNNYNGTYTIKEYLSACGTEISSCIKDSFPTLLEHTSVDNLALTVGPGRHGYLVYEDDNDACGGYVEVVVLDTIRPMDISKKSIDSVKCYGNNDGAISLYLKGGTSPYTLSYDKFWFDEKENQSKEAHESRTYTKSQLNLLLNNIEKNDGTIVVDSTYSVDINNLSAAKYCFTIVDANGCVRSLGVDGSIDTLTVRQPDSMHIDVYASGSCPDKAGLVTDNIAVFGQNAKGGIPPYLYYAAKKGETGESSDNSYFDLPVHTNDIVTYAFEDANQCHYEKDIVIDPQPIPVERYDFILSTWSQRNDVVALIDLCAPDVAFDSVTYFINDENVEVLDKRMYIYDIHAPQNKELYEELSKVNTKTEVSDMFFQKHFNLCVDSALAKHVQFIRRNNLVTYTWNANLNKNVVKDSLKPKNDSIWVQDEIRMRAYFKGCAYDVTRNGCFIIATDNYQIYNGGLSGETDILDLQLYPNPFIRTEQDECQIRVTVASKTEGDIYLYTLDGKTADNQTGLMKTHFNANKESGWQQLAGSLYNRPDQPYVYQKTFVVKADDLKSGAEAIVVLVRTANDAKSTYLLVK